MREADKLKLLIAKLNKLAITGKMLLPEPSPNDIYEIEPGERFDDSTIVNIKIDKNCPDQYLADLILLTVEIRSYLRNVIDAEFDINEKQRFIRDYIQLLDQNIYYLLHKRPKILFENPEEANRVRETRYLRLQKIFYDGIVKKVVDESLMYLKNELTFELNGLRRNEGIKRKVLNHEEPKTFNELFYDVSDIEPCISVLRKITPPYLNDDNYYIGSNKGIFPAWLEALQNMSIIKWCSSLTYKDLLNSEFAGLKLSKDASEFRKPYSRIEKIKPELKLLLSQLSLLGKQGK